jgi:hypothetical protein
MLWYCAFTWHPNTTRQQVAERILKVHDAGLHRKDQIKGWYDLAGGGSGFLMVEVDTPQQVTAMLQPYMDLMDWDVRAVYPLNYDEQIQQFRQLAGKAPITP